MSSGPRKSILARVGRLRPAPGSNRKVLDGPDQHCQMGASGESIYSAMFPGCLNYLL
jgi:hypothetical protein